MQPIKEIRSKIRGIVKGKNPTKSQVRRSPHVFLLQQRVNYNDGEVYREENAFNSSPNENAKLAVAQLKTAMQTSN